MFPEASLHPTVIVYTRPLPLPARSALRFTVRFPVISQSGAVSPSPVPSTGSLLLTEVILQTGAALQVSDAETATVTGTILWSGGQRTFGLAVTLAILGGVVSTTFTMTVSDAVSPLPSSTVSVMVCAPKDNGTVGFGSLAVPNEPVQVNVREPPFGSLEAEPSNMTLAPEGDVHSTVRSGPALAVGGRFGTVTF